MNVHSTSTTAESGHSQEKLLGEQMEEKILHILSIYPKISPSMMQISIGSNMPAHIWKAAWRKLLGEGKVRQDFIVATTPTGRSQSHTIYSIAPQE